MKKSTISIITNITIVLFSLFVINSISTINTSISISHNVSALSYQSNIGLSFTFNPTASISVSGDLSIDDLVPGSFMDSNIISVSASSNSTGGYVLYATVGDDTHTNPSYNNTNLNHSNGTNTFTSLSTNKTTLSSFDENTNTWGYSYCLSSNDCTSSANWISGDYDSNNGVPDTGYNGLPLYTNTGVKLGETINNAGTTSLEFKIGARANVNQASGTYTNTINFTAITKVLTTSYTISYNQNVGDTSDIVSNMPSNVASTTITADTIITIPSDSSSVPVREGYTFKGWCDTIPSHTVLTDSCPLGYHTYLPGDSLTITNTGITTNISLYAMWRNNKPYIQDLTLSDCMVNVGQNGNAENIGDNITVYDKRSSNYPSGDEGDYTVRYINGACWMTQNLRIQGTISPTYSNFTGSNFNVSAYDLKTNGGSGGKCNSANGNGYNNACSRTPDSADLTTIGNGATTRTVGRWYNYYAATAGTISGSSNSTNATKDICPSGWKLPTGPSATANRDFSKLVGNTTSGWQNPTTGLSAFGAVAGGTYNNGSILYAGYGNFYSATTYSATDRYFLDYGSSNNQFNGNNNTFRCSGNFVRCVRTT